MNYSGNYRVLVSRFLNGNPLETETLPPVRITYDNDDDDDDDADAAVAASDDDGDHDYDDEYA